MIRLLLFTEELKKTPNNRLLILQQRERTSMYTRE